MSTDQSLGESDSAADFSGSEDEWRPNQTSNRDDSGDTSDDHDEDVFEESPPKRKSAGGLTSGNKALTKAKRGRNGRVSLNASLRTKMFKKYKPPPKTFTPPKIVNKPNETTTSASKNDDSDSGSSGDDCLVNADKIDLNSSFFDKKQPENNSSKEPIFDCDGGMALTDSEDTDDEMENVDEDENDQTRPSQLNTFNNFFEYNKNIEQVKNQIQNIEAKKVVEQNVDVSSLLAMGEQCNPSINKTVKTSNSNKRKNIENSDSDWEEVEEHEILETTTNKDDVLQVTVALPQHQKRVKKITDEEASLMRHLNRVIKENQLIFHKASLLFHIAHGNHLNRSINNPSLMAAALKLLPNKKCYPDGRTEIKYFESITKWYNSVMKLKSDEMYLNVLKKRPSLAISLSIQIKFKEAICKRDYILIFIILLRAMGIQCRMVINLVPLPLRPAQDDLCTVKLKKPNNENVKNSKKKSKDNSSTKAKEEQPKKIIVKSKHFEENARMLMKNEIEKVSNKNVEPKKEIQSQTKLSAEISGSSRKMNSEKKLKSKSATESSKNSSSKSTEKQKDQIELNFSPRKTRRQAQKITENKTVKLQNGNPDNKAGVVDKCSSNLKKSKITETISNEENKQIKRKENRKLIPKLIVTNSKSVKNNALLEQNSSKNKNRSTSLSPAAVKKESLKQNTSTNKSRSPSPKFHISPLFTQTKPNSTESVNAIDKKLLDLKKSDSKTKQSSSSNTRKSSRSPSPKFHVSPLFTQTKSNIKDSPTITAAKKPVRTSKRNVLTVPQIDGANDDVISTKKKSTSKRNKTTTNTVNSDSDDSDFQISPPKKSKPSTSSGICKNKVLDQIKKRDNRVLSTDGENSPKVKTKKSVDLWIEVYSELEEKWVTIDLFKSKVHCVDSIRKAATTPIAYVFAWNNDNSLKDVSPRYCPQWNTVTRKIRVDKEWLHEAIRQYLGKKNVRDKAEDRELEKIHLDKPLPTTISEYKNHPLYALERHLLKFESIYPPNAVTLGFVRGEPVYPRDCVHTLHSREIWLKSARVVKPKQEPYKIVKARPKWDRINNQVIKDIPLEIFGYWQTMEYDPPTAENGIVPRNAYGNVDLFKESMLPKKTVHLKLPNLNRICKKLKIDCAPAVIGFDFHQGMCHPLLDGFVVCEEYSEKVIEAWNKDQEEMERKEEEKYEQRVYGNWRKLIKGLLIRRRLQMKYNFDNLGGPSKKQKKN